ncbi:dihydropteroate synthase [Raineyella sp. W15-4]|uniref:dihydropteroate synthase n=1 Tax=Raineyella sp. W15-4 TaxID=3081651 RepID=UPI0029554428|nr:dihydropteroate synthase [Raineyella sp. W15-4]WOQ16301.1 dihydropteroate synthase [Raineyella sp. W15-4]
MSRIPSAPRTQVMGIVNVTPDSFSDGGEHFGTDAAVRHGLRLLAEGADMLDVGGESTRPGIARTPEAEELRRVVPVVEQLAARGATVSVDTMRASVARATAAVGARIINDVSGGLADPEMYAAVAESGCAYVLMHWRGHSTEMDRRTTYDDVVGQVRDEVAARLARAVDAGIAVDDIIVDPGIGFAKTREQDWELLRHVDRLSALGRPVLIGVSRKRLLGQVVTGTGAEHSPKDRDFATAAVTGWMAERGIWAVRTHEVRAQRDAIAVVRALRGEGPRNAVTDRVVGTFLDSGEELR